MENVLGVFQNSKFFLFPARNMMLLLDSSPCEPVRVPRIKFHKNIEATLTLRNFSVFELVKVTIYSCFLRLPITSDLVA